MSPQISKRGVAAKYSDSGMISTEEITRNIDFFVRIAKMARSSDVSINGQNKKAIKSLQSVKGK